MTRLAETFAREADPDLFRELVSSDDGKSFADARQAARVLRGQGWQDADSREVLEAVRTGNEYCGHYFDFRWPEGREPAKDN